MRADGSGLRRVTDMQRADPAPAPPEGDATEALAARAAARARGGVERGPVDCRDGRAPASFTSRGDAYRIAADGAEPQPLAARATASPISRSRPTARASAFLRDGDLWVWPLDGAGAQPSA